MRWGNARVTLCTRHIQMKMKIQEQLQALKTKLFMFMSAVCVQVDGVIVLAVCSSPVVDSR